METKGVNGRDLLIDLESGSRDVTSEQNNRILVNSIVGQGRTTLKGSSNGLTGLKDERNQEMNCCPSLSGEDRKSEGEKIELLENLGGDKEKKKWSKKPPRPPRPPTVSLLDAADQKLINELSELAMMKQARIERMKALKKMKNSKPASSSSNLGALIITVIFCLVILWQGVLSRHGPSISFHGSPSSSSGLQGSLISIQFYHKNNSATISPLSSTSAAPNV